MNFFASLLFIAALSYPMIALSHSQRQIPKAKGPESTQEQDRFRRIDMIYKTSVKPIFEKKCIDCHSSMTRHPWYHKIPGIKGFIDDDIIEGKKHLDITEGFPFRGHGTPKEDLEAIKEVTQTGSMPPFRYKVLHPFSGLTKEEKATVLEWIQESQQIMGKEE